MYELLLFALPWVAITGGFAISLSMVYGGVGMSDFEVPGESLPRTRAPQSTSKHNVVRTFCSPL